VPCSPLRSVVRRFWSVIGAGGTVADAAAVVGVSLGTGRLWFADVGGVKPSLSEPTATGPRPRLTYADRVEIEIGVRTNESLRSIGLRLGRPASTIKYEIDVNATKNCADGRKSGYRRKAAFGARQSGMTAQVLYRAQLAQARSEVRARRPKASKLAQRERCHPKLFTSQFMCRAREVCVVNCTRACGLDVGCASRSAAPVSVADAYPTWSTSASAHRK
jgi:IS30 family transposase